ncbi:MAG: hypothetical protein CMJ46_14745, partial [Planctomyces sp.]|nr:hypothetical protein [Planctomyces sp.]
MAKKKSKADTAGKNPEQKPAAQASPKTSDSPHPEKFTIVGIGASAGGLAALKTFFAYVPKDSGVAYVIVVHLSPDHKSHLAELLQPLIHMPVQQVTESIRLEPDHVYVIPPNANLDTIDTHLRLSELEELRQERAPIDHFFRTLAQMHDGHAIGVILTGTGSDGTLGIKEIKEKGGSCLVQDPTEAEYDGMPQSAIATGMIDLILPLAEIPQAILRIASTRPRLPAIVDEDQTGSEAGRLLQKVFAHLRSCTGRDFTSYKRATMIRRIERRMQLRQIEELDDYLDLLRREPDEIRILGDDLLITVTSFFRDPAVFQKLEAEVIPQLFDEKRDGGPIRVWSVGCATGEEAFSLAMLLMEEANRREISSPIQVFASDLHERSLKKAREGFYPGEIASDVSPERLKQFFVKEKDGYRIRKELREIVIFAPHNLLRDPPFSRLDLISCRNVLIYIQRKVQRDIIELFHYALRSEGFLVLGTSETIDTTDLFRMDDKKCCIYRKRTVPAPEPRLPVFPLTHTRMLSDPRQEERSSAPIFYGALHLRMVEQYAPPSALVSPDDKIVHLSEHAGRYLLNPGGEPTVNILKLARNELQIELRAALHAARSQEVPIDSKPIRVQLNGAPCMIVLHVRPSLEKNQKGFALIIFEERKISEASPDRDPASQIEDQTFPEGEITAGLVRVLEAELEQTRQHLQAIIEECETSQEEMKAANEEMQSTNEELRSTFEELETSKEELQSMNEELQTVNQENRHKVDELSQLSSDLQNLLVATDIATLFLDRDLRILRFTPKVGNLFNVRMTDRGRPLADLTHRLGYDQLLGDARLILETLVPIDREVADNEGHWYQTRLMPYRTTEDRIEGVVITFVDISHRKMAQEKVRRSEMQLQALVEASTNVIYRMNADWSRMERLDGHGFIADHDRPEMQWLEKYIPRHEQERLRQAIQTAIDNRQPFVLEHEVWRVDGSIGWMYSRAIPILDHDGNIIEWFGSANDVTQSKQTADILRRDAETFVSLVEESPLGIYTVDSEFKIRNISAGARSIFENVDPLIGRDFSEAVRIIWPEPCATGVIQAFQHTLETGRPYISPGVTLERADTGNLESYEWQIIRITLADGEFGVVCYFYETTQLQEASAAVRFSEARYRKLFESIDEGFCVFDMIYDDAGHPVDYRFLEVNPAFEQHTGLSNAEGRKMRELVPDHEQE